MERTRWVYVLAASGLILAGSTWWLLTEFGVLAAVLWSLFGSGLVFSAGFAVLLLVDAVCGRHPTSTRPRRTATAGRRLST